MLSEEKRKCEVSEAISDLGKTVELLVMNQAVMKYDWGTSELHPLWEQKIQEDVPH